MNWYKIAQQKKKKARVLNPNYLTQGKYPGVLLQIPDLPDRFFFYIKKDIRDNIYTNAYEYNDKSLQSRIFKNKMFTKSRFGNPSPDISYQMFSQSKEHKEKDFYIADPKYIYLIAEGLEKIGYDVEELYPFFNQQYEPPVTNANGTVNGDTLQLKFDSSIGKKPKEHIKQIGFKGRMLSKGNFIWTKPISNVIDIIQTLEKLFYVPGLNIQPLIKDIYPYIKNLISQMDITQAFNLHNSLNPNEGFSDNYIRPLLEKILEPYIDFETGEIKDESILSSFAN